MNPSFSDGSILDELGADMEGCMHLQGFDGALSREDFPLGGPELLVDPDGPIDCHHRL